MNQDLLIEMYEDGYYDQNLVDRLRVILEQFAIAIEKVNSDADIYHEADISIKKINKLKPLFEEKECELDGLAADYIVEAMMMILQDAQHFDVDPQELLSAKEW